MNTQSVLILFISKILHATLLYMNHPVKFQDAFDINNSENRKGLGQSIEFKLYTELLYCMQRTNIAFFEDIYNIYKYLLQFFA